MRARSVEAMRPKGKGMPKGETSCSPGDAPEKRAKGSKPGVAASAAPSPGTARLAASDLATRRRVGMRRS